MTEQCKIKPEQDVQTFKRLSVQTDSGIFVCQLNSLTGSTLLKFP